MTSFFVVGGATNHTSFAQRAKNLDSRLKENLLAKPFWTIPDPHPSFLLAKNVVPVGRLFKLDTKDYRRRSLRFVLGASLTLSSKLCGCAQSKFNWATRNTRDPRAPPPAACPLCNQRVTERGGRRKI